MLTSLCAIALFLFATLVIARDEMRVTRRIEAARDRRAQRATRAAVRNIGGMYSHATIRHATRGERPLRSEHAASTALQGHALYRATIAAMHAPTRK